MNEAWIFFAAILLTLGLWRIAESVDGIAKAYKDAHATCPGPLKAGDYYTPEE